MRERRTIGFVQVAKGLPTAERLTAAGWWAHLVGVPRAHRINIELTILAKKIEDLCILGGRGSLELADLPQSV